MSIELGSDVQIADPHFAERDGGVVLVTNAGGRLAGCVFSGVWSDS